MGNFGFDERVGDDVVQKFVRGSCRVFRCDLLLCCHPRISAVNGVPHLSSHTGAFFQTDLLNSHPATSARCVSEFERQAVKEVRENDSRLNILIRRFEEMARPVNPMIKAHLFLREAKLSAEEQSQIAGALRGGLSCMYDTGIRTVSVEMMKTLKVRAALNDE